MQKLLLTVCAVLAIFEVSGQYTQTVTPVMEFGLIEELHLPPAETKGSVYLNEDWIKSEIHFKQGVFAINKLETIPVKLDLKTNTLELQTREGIKALQSSKVEKLQWINPASNQPEEFVPCDQFTFNGTRLSGFCKISGTTVKVIRRDYIEVIKANYNVALDVGNKDDQIIKKYKLYLWRDKLLVECNRKTFYTFMDDKAAPVKKYIKKNNLRISREEDVRLMVDFYNH